MPRKKKATTGQEPEVVAAVAGEATPPPAPPKPVIVVEATPEPEVVEVPAKVIKVGGYIATPHGWRPVH